MSFMSIFSVRDTTEFTITLDMGFGRFDTNLPGNSNQSHTYGEALSEDEKAAVLEYLKTL